MPDIYNVNEEIKTASNVQNFVYHKVTKPSSLYAIAKENDLNPELLSTINGLALTDRVITDQLLMFPKKDFSYYITKLGDTLDIVARTFNTDLQKVIDQNPVIYLHEGQLIVGKQR